MLCFNTRQSVLDFGLVPKGGNPPISLPLLSPSLPAVHSWLLQLEVSVKKNLEIAPPVLRVTLKDGKKHELSVQGLKREVLFSFRSPFLSKHHTFLFQSFCLIRSHLPHLDAGDPPEARLPGSRGRHCQGRSRPRYALLKALPTLLPAAAKPNETMDALSAHLTYLFSSRFHTERAWRR